MLSASDKSNSKGGGGDYSVDSGLFCLQACTVRDFPPGFIITRGGGEGHVLVLLVSQPRAWHPSEFVPTERFVYEFRQIFKLGKHKRDMSTIADMLSATV